jgi:hypothetical protein
MTLPQETWLSLLASDPRPALLASDEPFARCVTMTEVLGLPEGDPGARAARQAVVDDPRTRALAARLPDWEAGFSFGGHNSPAFPPNLLRLLHGMGVRAGDFAEIERTLDAMLRHQADDGRFLTPTRAKTGGAVTWAALPCDHFATLEVLLLFGRHKAPELRAAIARVAETFVPTAQGRAWLCVPDPVVKWRGPGRKGDACLQVTVEALRLFGLLPAAERPEHLADAVRTVLRAWRLRATERPYQFGHGPRFVSGKWPPTWYDAAAVVGAIAPYEPAWSGPSAAPEDRQSAAELVAALATAFGPDGLVTPRSCFKGFEASSFGQKKRPSPWATARLCGALRACSSLIAAGGG